MGVEDEGEGFQGKLYKTFHLGQAGAILASGLSMDDKTAVSCSTNKKVLLWDVVSGRCLGSLDGHNADVSCCSFGGDLLVTGSKDGMLYLWKHKEMKRCSRIDVHAGPVHSCVVSPNTRFLASSSEDMSIRVYTIRGGDGEFIQGPQVKLLTGHKAGVNDVNFSIDSCALVSASSDGCIKIWDVETGDCLMTLEDEENTKISNVGFSADGRYVVACTKNAINVYSISKRKVSWKIEDDKGFQSIACHPAENTFVAVTMDGALTSYNINKKSQIFKKSTDHRGPILTVSYSLSGKMAVTGGIDGKILAFV